MKSYLLVLFSLLFVFNASASASDDVNSTYDYSAYDAYEAEEFVDESLYHQQAELDEGFPNFYRQDSFWDPSPRNRLVIRIDKSERGRSSTAQTMSVELDGRRIHYWWVSTGRERQETNKQGRQTWSRTPAGKFRIQWMSRDHFSQAWQAPMPYAMFFIGGIAIHAASQDAIHKLGRRASGGCVRIHPDNAAILWDLVRKVGMKNVAIIVEGY